MDRCDLPASAHGKTTYRSITIDKQEVEFSDGFDLHTRSYEEIIAGRGLRLEAVRPSIDIVAALRSAQLQSNRGERHPFVSKFLSVSPAPRRLAPEIAGEGSGRHNNRNPR